MSETESERFEVLGVDEANEPAVGLIARPGDGDAVAGAILRARRHGHQTIVTATSPGSEALEYASQLGAIVVSPTKRGHNGSDLEAELSSAAREAGFPGLLLQDDLTARIDYQASVNELTGADAYATNCVRAPRIQESPEVMVGIPAYNEESSIAEVVREAGEYANTVLVVDDGSTDETVARAEAAGAEVITHESNKGYGGALKTVFVEAERAGASHLVILDGDGQHDPNDIPKLVARQDSEGAEIVIGSRFASESETDLPLYRRFGLWIVNVLTNLSMGVVRDRSYIEDTQSGFRVYDSEAIASLADDDDIGTNMSASTDILYHAHRNGYDVQEVGTTIDYEVEDASTRNPVSHGLQLVSNILRTIERERPVTALGVPGFVSAVVGIGFGYLTISNYLTTGVFPLGIAIISVFFALIGTFAAFTGIILHSLETHLN